MRPRPTLLITDDEQVCRETLQAFLEQAGYETLLAASGEEAIDCVSSRPVDLLLLDYQLPGMTGLETLRVVRNEYELLPCILMTGSDSRSLLTQALSLRAFTVLSKPLSRGLVTVSVQRALSRGLGPQAPRA